MRDPSPYAGTTVKIRAGVAEIGGLDAEIIDWYEHTGAKRTWRQALAAGDLRAQSYLVYRGQAGLPDDDDVLLARIDGMTRIVHVTQLDGYQPPVTPTPTPAPTPVSESEIGEPCLACQVPLAGGDQVAVVVLGPGGDPAARAACLAGDSYQGVAVELHWACRTGDTSLEES